MPSRPRRGQFTDFLERANAKTAIPGLDLAIVRDIVDSNHKAATEPEGVTYAEVDAGGVPALWAIPEGADPDKALLHFHFGGSVAASMHSDRKAAGHIAKAAGARSLVVDFRLAPEHPYPAQLDDAETAYRWLLSQGYEPRNIGSTGHSIGGALAVMLPLRLLAKGEATPGAIVSVSPWTDLTIQNPSVDANEDKDKMLSRVAAQRRCGRPACSSRKGEAGINSRTTLSGLQLGEERRQVDEAPVVGEFPVGRLEHAELQHLDRSAGGGSAVEGPGVRAGEDEADREPIVLGDDTDRRGGEVGDRVEERRQHRAGLLEAGGGAVGGVVAEVRRVQGEQGVEVTQVDELDVLVGKPVQVGGGRSGLDVRGRHAFSPMRLDGAAPPRSWTAWNRAEQAGWTIRLWHAFWPA
nr:alpha/beta hydrolase [Streptomyces ureilyticus]